MDNFQNFALDLHDVLVNLKDITLYESRRKEEPKNPFNKFGRRSFSQSDEDGLTLEIIKRLGFNKGNFAEFGVGNGTENNTLLLASLGWNGFWVDASELAFKYKMSNKFTHYKRLINLDNVLETFIEGCNYIKREKINYISFDFDNNDYYLVKKLLDNNVHPEVFVVEYNSKFIPPIEWVVDYDPNSSWNFDDYFSASLTSYVKLFEQHDYFLVCCNHFTGANAFFIKNEYRDKFKEVPSDINDIWVEPRYYIPHKYGHRSSPRTAQVVINRLVDNR